MDSVGFPRECIPFAAFDKALPAVQNRMEIAKTNGRDDALFFPNDRFLKFDGGALLAHSSTLSQITTSTHGALYHVTFRHTYDQVPSGSLPD